MLCELHTGPARFTDGLNIPQRAGSDAQTIVSELHGKYTESMTRGKAFYGASASGGIALIVPATTGGHPTLWNPQGSGVYVSLIRLSLSYVSGTNAPTAIEWAVTANAGANIGTAAPVVTFTNVAPSPALIGGTGVSKVRWAPTTNTFAAAPAFIVPTGFALATMAAASTPAPFTINMEYDGALGIAPNTAISLCTQAATTTALFQVGLWWEEIDITY